MNAGNVNVGTSTERQRSPLIATVVYVAAVVAFGWVIFGVVADMLDRRAGLAATRNILDQLQGRNGAFPNGPGAGFVPAGSPYLEGSTVTVAGATLLQRVTSAVLAVGGNVLSTQVDLQSEKSKSGFVGVIANCEMDQPALQRLLYDLEAGMPFLFVDQLVVQTSAISGVRDGRMRVMLTVYGQWQGGK
jgi:general secretion pathway protein M